MSERREAKARGRAWLAPRRPGLQAPPARLLALLLILFAGGCATVPTEYREPPPLSAERREDLNARVFDRVWELVNDRYFDASFRGVDWPAMRAKYRMEAVTARNDTALYRVLNRMGAELKESHLVALEPRRVHERRVEHRAAIGVRWRMIDGKRVITDVVPGGPADRVGIRRGWLVVSRNGAPIRDEEVFIARVGQPVTYGFLDENDEARTFTLQPELVNFERVEERGLADGFVYLRFDYFGRDTLHWLSQRLKANASAPGVVIDLRDNHGGNALALSVALTEFFDRAVPAGVMVSRGGRTRETQSLSWFSAKYGGRVVLLVGPQTGSAAEIFAHVLQFHRRATVVGRTTAGAVIYSRSYRLPGGGELQVPVTDYVGLDGKRLEGRGVVPDVVMPEPTLEELRAVRDRELEKALEILRGAAR